MSRQHAASSLPRDRDIAKILDLDLRGFEDWDSLPIPPYDSQAVNVMNAPSWGNTQGYAVREAWSTRLNTDLLNLAIVFQRSWKLRVLRIRATRELNPQEPLLNRRDYLSSSSVCNLISASHLTSLDLDLCGTRLISHQSQGQDDEFHVCTSVATLLTTLQHFRLRMRTICADVLRPEQHSTNLRLKEVLVNLSLSNELPLATSASHAACCRPSPGGLLQLKIEIEKQAQVLVAQMEDPRIVRVLTHEPLSLELRAFDVLTSRYVALSEGAGWDDDGKAIEDEVSEEESEISSLSSFEDE